MSTVRVRRAGRTRLALLLTGCTAVLGLLAATAAQSHAAQRGTTTLTIWYAENDLPVPTVKLLNKQFEKSHPGVVIKAKWFSGSDLQTIGKLSLASNNPPDASQIGIPYPVVAQLVKAGKLTDLQPYATKFGWAQKFDPSDYNLGRWDKNGVQGRGDLYGIYQEIEPLGVYYNKAELKKLGVGVPKTFAAFEADLAMAKSNGETPLMFANLDKWPGVHVFYEVEDQMVPKSALRGFFSHRNNFPTSGNVQAAALLQSWATSGYYPAGYQGISYDDAGKQFAQGTGVFFPTGTWLAPQLSAAMGRNVGFFLMPPGGHQSGYAATSGTNQLWLVPGKAKNPELAAEYLNFISSTPAGLLYAREGLIPGMKLTRQPRYAPGSLYADIYKAGVALQRSDGSVPYIDVTTPSMYDTLTAGLQSVLGGQESPSDFVKAVQKDYSGSH